MQSIWLHHRLTLAAIGLSMALSVQAAATRVSLKLVSEGFISPVAYTPLADGRALVVDQVGFVRLLDAQGQLRQEPVLDATRMLAKINQGAFDERGVVSIALHPAFAENRRVFLSYTPPLRPGGPVGFDCMLRISEFQMPASEPLRIDPASERILIDIDHPYANHIGGRLAFGPDGLLYVGTGDGGAGNDRGKRPLTGNGQNLDTLLGKILRIDVNAADGRGIPKDNPFADGKDARPEIYAYGLRNPWGMTFDMGGDRALYAADVGQTMFEELNRIEKGGNYGWFLREGFAGFDPDHPTKLPDAIPAKGARGEPLLDPIAVYKNANGYKRDAEAYGTSVTGGYIYRGSAIPQLAGHYIYGDWSRSWALPQGQLLVAWRPESGQGRWRVEPLELASPEKLGAYITAFGQDLQGEIYVMTNGSNSLIPGRGKLWKMVPANP